VKDVNIESPARLAVF